MTKKKVKTVQANNAESLDVAIENMQLRMEVDGWELDKARPFWAQNRTYEFCSQLTFTKTYKTYNDPFDNIPALLLDNVGVE